MVSVKTAAEISTSMKCVPATDTDTMDVAPAVAVAALHNCGAVPVV